MRRLPVRPTLFGSFLVLACALALGIGPSAQATTNLVPNPGFEMDCGGVPPVPCNWSASSGATIERDTTTSHMDMASMKVTLTGSATFEGARSDCQNIAITGMHAFSVWYQTSDATANSVQVGGSAFTGLNCTVSNTPFATNITPERDGNWHQIQAALNVPAGTLSVNFALFVGSQTTGQTPSVNFDDVDFEQELLAVTLSSFRAARSAKGVVVRWRTGAELNTLGFYVYRQRAGGRRVRVNRRIIPALSVMRGLPGGAYSYVDRRAPRSALRYWLQEVDSSGNRSWHGPVRVGAA